MRQWLAFIVMALLGVSSAARSIDPATFFVRCVKVSPYVTSVTPFICASVIKWRAWHAPREVRMATMEQNYKKLTNSASLWFEHVKKEFVAVKHQLTSISAQISGFQKVVITAHLYSAEQHKKTQQEIRNIKQNVDKIVVNQDKHTQMLYQILAVLQKNYPDAAQLSALSTTAVSSQNNSQGQWIRSLFSRFINQQPTASVQ